MADKMSKLVLPVKSGNTITNKEFDVGGGGNTFIGTTAEWNALTTEQQNAYDCRVLTDDDLDTKSVIDNLTSDSSTDALSAKQGKVLKGLIDSKSNSDYFCAYTLVEKPIEFIDTTSGKTMFKLYGVLTLKDDILTFDGYKIDKTSDFPSGGMVIAYRADITSTFTELSGYEWDTDWIVENFSKYMDPDAYDGHVIGWCEIFSVPVYTQIAYVSGDGLKICLTHYGTFSDTRIKVDFLHFSAKIKPRTT